MKKFVLIALLILSVLTVKAQYTVEVESWAGDPSRDIWVYVGSLPPNGSATFQKLKVEVLGGHYINSTGETTFYVTTRNVLTVNETVMGGTNSGQFTLRAFNNSSGGLDFYIYTAGYSYAAYSVRATVVGAAGNPFNLTGNGSSQQLVPCTVQAIAPPGLPSSGTEQSLTVNPIMITDVAGNIGLNTSDMDPAYKLSVNGFIRSKEIKVETGGPIMSLIKDIY